MNEDLRSSLNRVRIMHIVFLGSAVVYLVVLFVLAGAGVLPLVAFDALVLTILSIALGVIAVGSLVLAYFSPRLVERQAASQPEVPISIPFIAHIFRLSFLESISIYGLVLGLFGAGWPVILPFFVISFGAMLLTFPMWKTVL